MIQLSAASLLHDMHVPDLLCVCRTLLVPVVLPTACRDLSSR